MSVYCVFQTIVQDIQGTEYKLDFDALQAIFDDEVKADAYIEKHPPQIRKHMHVEMWQVQ